MEHLTPGQALARMKELIRTGKPGKNYTFVPSDKNRELVEKFFLDDNKRIEILLSITDEDYEKDEYSIDEDHSDDYLYVFLKRDVELRRRYSSNFDFEKVDIYVKFTLSGYGNNICIVISFHENKNY